MPLEREVLSQSLSQEIIMNRCRIFLLLAFCLPLLQLMSAQTRTETAPPPGTVTGSGTANYLSLWTGSTTLGNSHIFQSGGDTGIGTTSPQYALDVDGHINSSAGYLIGESLVLTMPGGSADDNIALGYQAFLNNTSGVSNTASGYQALEANTQGPGNTANGATALSSNTTGGDNTAAGSGALSSNTTAWGNTASGSGALAFSTTGAYNTASGYSALEYNSTGSYNTADGFQALSPNSAGSYNVAVGYNAAANVSGGSNNVHISNEGSSGDSGTIRIGTSGTQTAFFAAGIYGASAGSNSAIPVLVDSAGQLVTVSSSRRFKEDIQDMGDASSDLMRLRPVTFRYKKPLADGSQPIQYGLIAEEVAEVYPDLVAYSADGQIETVKYQLLDPMLLNEVQRQQAEAQRQKAEIRDLQERLGKLELALAVLSHAPESR
jgi:hypothetical protein